MAEFRSSSPTPLQAVLEPRVYISNSYCNVIILVHVLVVRTKQQHKYNTKIILSFQIYNCMTLLYKIYNYMIFPNNICTF